MTTHRFCAIALFCLIWPVAARGQPAPGAPAATPPALVEPPVSDPMLAPPDAAPGEVRTRGTRCSLIRHSPDYLTGVDAFERTLAQHRIALAAVLPTLAGAAGYVHNFNVLDVTLGGVELVAPPPTIWSIAAPAAWNIVNPRGIYGLETSDMNTQVATLSLADRRRVLAASTVSAMLATLAAERVAELDRVGLRSSLERLVLTQTRLKFSRGTELDLDRAQQDVEAARALVISGDESLRQAREEFGRTLGSPTPLGAPTDLDLEGFEHAIATTCQLANNVELRPDVVAARTRVAIAQRQITDAKLMFAPTLNVAAQAEAATANTLGPTETFEIAATLNLPLYDGGVRYGALRDAKAATDPGDASARVAAHRGRDRVVAGGARDRGRRGGARRRQATTRPRATDRRTHARRLRQRRRHQSRSRDLGASAAAGRDQPRLARLPSGGGSRQRRSRQRGVCLLSPSHHDRHAFRVSALVAIGLLGACTDTKKPAAAPPPPASVAFVTVEKRDGSRSISRPSARSTATSTPISARA